MSPFDFSTFDQRERNGFNAAIVRLLEMARDENAAGNRMTANALNAAAKRLGVPQSLIGSIVARVHS